MSEEPSDSGLEAALIQHRPQLLRFLRARGAGDMAEDLLHEVWIRVTTGKPGPIAAPLAYLHKVANAVMIDQYRSARQAHRRDQDWSGIHHNEQGISADPSPERLLISAQEAGRVLAMLEKLGPRTAAIFRRHRVDGLAQKVVAAEFGVSLSTVEGDLRTAYRALAEWKASSKDEGE